jgi:hypothetical protein
MTLELFDKFDASEGFNGVVGEILNATFLDNQIQELYEKDPDQLEALLVNVGESAREYINKDGQLNLDALKKRLSISKRIGILIGAWFDEQFAAHIETRSDEHGDSFITQATAVSFEDEIARLKSEGKEDRVDGSNIILHSGSFLQRAGSMAYMLGALQGVFESISTEKSIKLPLSSRIVMGSSDSKKDGAFTGTGFAKMRAVAKKVGATVTRLTPGELKKSPKPNEIQLIFPEQSGLPMSIDGKKVDDKALRWYKEIYDDSVGTTWMLSSELLVGVYMVGGLSKDEALSKAGIRKPDEDFAAQLVKLETQLKPATAVAAKPAEPEAPAEDAA